MPSKATAGADWASAAVEMAMPAASSTAAGRAHPGPEMSVFRADVLPDDEVVGAVEGHRRCALVVGGAVEIGMPGPSSTAPAGLTRAP